MNAFRHADGQQIGQARPEKELPRCRKGAKGQVKLAHQLRAGMAMTLRWIADRLHIECWTCVLNLLHEKQ